MDNLNTGTLLLYGLAVVFSALWIQYVVHKSKIPAIVGSKGPISSYLAALHYLGHGKDVIQQGYYRYSDGVFRVPTLFRWDYVASGPWRTAEIASAPEHILSFNQGAADILQSDYTMGPELTTNPYHVLAIRGSLTRNLGRCFPEVRDEMISAFDDVLALKDNEWKSLHVTPNVMKVVARTSNRIFVGLPVCREQEYIDLNVNYAVVVFMRGLFIRLLPSFLKPIFGPMISTRKSSVRQALKFLGPMIDERLEKDRVHGRDWPERPNDLISWLLDIAEGEERTASAIALRILATNAAAIHTTSMALTSALYNLTTHPEYIIPLREEAERVVAKEGWTKTAIGNMHKIDSFVRESQRLTGVGAVALARKVMAKEGFKFSDGTTIPYGAFVSVPGNAMHYDQANYDRADEFDGSRFLNMGEEPTKHATEDDGSASGTFNRQMVSTGQKHLVFGHGRHACPGRFLAATELKSMIAHILINYDVKAETEGVRPPDEWFGANRFPNREGKIFIRKRE
ncbi:cytochrome P450 [Mycena galericulata]|nr:cytochrome P450 [Mycena galericulata]